MAEMIHIALAANHRYINGLLVTMSSMIRSAVDKKRLCFHIFSDGLTSEDKDMVVRFALEGGAGDPQFHEPDMRPISAQFRAYKESHTAFLRIFLCQFLDLDWVLYSDVDTLWLRDVGELWNLRDESKTLQWCEDLPSVIAWIRTYSVKWNPSFDESRYCCSGVALMNLKKMRSAEVPRKCIEFVTEWGTPPLVDQDILNFICRNDAGILPQHWDCMMPTREAVNGVVLHFTGLGSMFNSDFSGWRPLYYLWFRYHRKYIAGDPLVKVCGPHKRFFFWLLGTFYPSRSLCALLAGGRSHRTDNYYRQLFFAWLWRHAKWRDVLK